MKHYTQHLHTLLFFFCLTGFPTHSQTHPFLDLNYEYYGYEDARCLGTKTEEDAKEMWIEVYVVDHVLMSSSSSHYIFDDKGRIKTLEQGSTTHYTYGEHGLWSKKVVNEKEIIRKIELDDQGRIAVLDSKHYHYDEQSRIDEISMDGKVYKRFEYDKDSQNFSLIEEFKNGELVSRRDFEYSLEPYFDSKREHEDLLSIVQLKTTTYGKENNTSVEYVTAYYLYDLLLKTTSKIEDAEEVTNTITSYKYNDNGRLIQKTDALSNSSSSGFADYFYNEKGHHTETKGYTDNGMTLSRTWKIRYQF